MPLLLERVSKSTSESVSDSVSEVFLESTRDKVAKLDILVVSLGYKGKEICKLLTVGCLLVLCADQRILLHLLTLSWLLALPAGAGHAPEDTCQQQAAGYDAHKHI